MPIVIQTRSLAVKEDCTDIVQLGRISTNEKERSLIEIGMSDKQVKNAFQMATQFTISDKTKRV